jgi:hypothetical protein
MRSRAKNVASEAIREELLAQVEHYGAAAPKADKTFRLESASYIVDVTQSESLVVDDAGVKILQEICRSDFPSLFKKLFEKKSYFVKKRGAEEQIASHGGGRLTAAFRRCFDIKPASAKLTVKEKKES